MNIIQKALATIEDSDLDSEKYPHGGFTAVLSTPSTDRDGDQLLREEWQDLPARIPIDIDHGMSVASTVGSGEPYWDDATGRMMIDVAFSSIPRAQEARSLVREGHIGGISVAFLTDKSKKDGVPRRELLNAGIVAIPSNRDAVILSAKEFALLKERAQTKVDDESDAQPEDDSKAVAGVETKASQAESSLIQGIHDAAAHLGATCAGQTEDNEPDPDTGADDGANSKSAVTFTVKPELDLPAFKEQLEKLGVFLTKSSDAESDSPQDDESAPADAASEAASEKEPAGEPAEAAAENSDEVAEKQAAELMASLLESDLLVSNLNI